MWEYSIPEFKNRWLLGGVCFALSGAALILLGCDNRDPAAGGQEPASRLEANRESGTSPAATTRTVTPTDEAPARQSLAELTAALVTRDQGGQKVAVRQLLAIGSPEAARILFDFVAALPPGELKENCVQQLSADTARDCLPAVFHALAVSEDEGVIRAASETLVKFADDSLIRETAARYDATTSSVERARLAAAVAHVQNKEALPALIEIVEQPEFPASEPLTAGAIKALRSISLPPAVDALLQKLDTAAIEDDQKQLTTEISQIERPEAEISLRQAARGNKAATVAATRAAAAYALSNYPTPETLELLRALMHDSDPRVGLAAAESLRAAERRLKGR